MRGFIAQVMVDTVVLAYVPSSRTCYSGRIAYTILQFHGAAPALQDPNDCYFHDACKLWLAERVEKVNSFAGVKSHQLLAGARDDDSCVAKVGSTTSYSTLQHEFASLRGLIAS